MLVRGVRSFVATEAGKKYRVSMGQILELPLDADWLRAGLVEAVEPAPAEPAPEPVVKRRRKGESNGG